MLTNPHLGISFALACVALASAQSWCDKNYMSSEPIVPPNGQFPIPPTVSGTLLALRCSPAIKPYLTSDAASPGYFLVDTPLVNSQIANAYPIDLSGSNNLTITISQGTTTLAQGQVPLNASKIQLEFSFAKLTPSTTPYPINCTASYSSFQTFTASTSLSFFPDPTSGSATKMDLRTGALLARPTNGSGPYSPVFPIGFYTAFDSYLASNLSILDELASQGFTVVHPIPPYDNLAAFNSMLDRMEQVGLYLMYDMRFIYQDISSVTSQVMAHQSRPNLLLWYSADEPDGSEDPLNATSVAYSTITSIDAYHPVSLVLNCQDYQFSSYAAGADVILQDTFMIGNNVTWSNEWNTPCTPDYGDCGCDNCQGIFEDISHRMDQYSQRIHILGWELQKVLWAVPQGFGQQQYWLRYPTGPEFILQSILAINHGALGIVSWTDPTTPAIKSSASLLALALPSITPYLFGSDVTFTQYTSSDRIDVGVWTVADKTLVLSTNLNYVNMTLDLRSVPGIPSGGWSINQVLNGSGATIQGTTVAFQSTGSGAFILSTNAGSSGPSSSNAFHPTTDPIVWDVLLVVLTAVCSLL